MQSYLRGCSLVVCLGLSLLSGCRNEEQKQIAPAHFSGEIKDDPKKQGNPITIERKKEIFATLVATQDSGLSVRKSYELVMAKFSISDEQLLEIENEGLKKVWPPLK